MLMSHRGRPIEGEVSDEFTLQPVADRLSELLGVTVRLEKNWLDDFSALLHCHFNGG
jgi:phosphoglycerate kinase